MKLLGMEPISLSRVVLDDVGDFWILCSAPSYFIIHHQDHGRPPLSLEAYRSNPLLDNQFDIVLRMY